MVRIVSTAAFSGSGGKLMPLFNGSLYHEIAGDLNAPIMPSDRQMQQREHALQAARKALNQKAYRARLKKKGRK